MALRTFGGAVAAIALTLAIPMTGALAQSKGKVLVVMSRADKLALKDGKTYATGYYLNEFVVPYRKLVAAGFEPVIANPNGDQPVMDVNSNSKLFFGGDAARADALPERAQKCASHALTIAKPRLVGDGVHRMASLLEHLACDLDAQALDSLCGRLPRLLAKSPAELA